MLPILDGLAKAHDAGVLHRDIKPGNIILHDNDGTPAPKLVDFGGAKLVASTDGLTSTGMIFGTPHYISPEQASCTRDVDARTDVWACGVLLYRLLVGAVPFDAPNLGALISKVHTAMPTSPASLGVAPALSAVILRCLEKHADARYRDAHALKVALCAALGLPSTAGSPEHPEIAPARVVAPREAAATLRPEALVTALQSIAPANDTVPAPPLTPSQGALLMPPAPPRGSVPPEFFGARITPLRAPPPDLVRAARKMEKLHQRALLALPVPANDVLPAAPPEPDVIERVPMNSLRAMAVASTVVLALAVAWSLSMLLR
jgi:serine/threonine-protein kinase